MFTRRKLTSRSRKVTPLLLVLSLTLLLFVLSPVANGETTDGEGASSLIPMANSSSAPAPLKLVPEPPADSGLDVRVWTDKKVYRINENARVNFSLNKSAYVYILDYTPEGGVHLIYPNKWEGNEKRGPGTHILPSDNYNFRVSGPPGTEYLQALATTKKIDIYQFVRYPNDPFRESGFPKVPNPENLRNEIKSGLSAKFGLHLGGEDSKLQFQLVPVEWDTDFYNFQVRSSQPTNQPPQARFSYSPSNPASGERVRFDGSGSYDPDGNIVRWEWDFDDDGNIDATGRQGYNTYYGTGRTLVRLTVTDNDGASSTTSQYIRIGPGNQSPNADFDYEPANPNVGDFVRFDGQLSSDPDGYINSWKWDFDGDGITDRSGQVVWKSFSSSGSKRVRLTVQDNQGATSTIRKIVRVSTTNQSPNADFDYSPSNPGVGETVRFDGTSSSDPDGRITSWEWDFDGDGNTDRTGSVVWYGFNSSGSKRVRLTVQDNQGATAVSSKTVQVRPPQPRFNEVEADNFYSNGSQSNQWYWHRSRGTYSRWIWYSLPNSPDRAYLNFGLLVTNQNGGSGYSASIEFTIEDRSGNTIERGRVDLSNTYRPQFSGDTNGIGYEAYGSYRINNPNELEGGFRVRVEWPPRDNRYHFATRRSALKLAYEY